MKFSVPLPLRASACVLVLTSPAAAQDWGGFYGGISGSYSQGTMTYSDGGPAVHDLAGPGQGFFLGYNVENGGLIYGGELNYTNAPKLAEDHGPDFHFKELIDLRARVGKAFGNVMLYGTLGYTTSTFDIDTDLEPGTNGYLAGLGVEYMFSDRFFVGGEVVHRQLAGPRNPPATYDTDFSFNTFSLRFGVSF